MESDAENANFGHVVDQDGVVTNPMMHGIDRERMWRGCRRPLKGVRHAETVTWQHHLMNVLDCFGGFWRWMTLDRSGQLWTAAVRQRL